MREMPERTTRQQAGLPRTCRSWTTTARPDDPEVLSTRGLGVLTQRQVIALQSAAGNHAVSSTLRSAQQVQGMVVQRWAWVAASQVKPDDPGLDSKMKTLASDKLVHDYGSNAEFKDHAAGKTDYLGNLPGPTSPGTWVRFAPTGSNLLGENHTAVTLEHVMAAVGSKSFIYEQFSVDAMPAGSAMRTAYEEENKDLFNRFGVGGVADKKQFGAESLFPKMGFALNTLLPFFTGAGKLDGLKPGAYLGQPAQRYVKIAWGHSKDVADEVKKLTAAKQKVLAPLKSLAKVFAATKAELDVFITSLPVDGYLGDALDTPAGKKLLPALLKFGKAFVAAMLARVSTDAGLTEQERKNLKKMPQGKSSEQQAVFDKWRNLHFSHAVRDAAKRGVRYAGMGRFHLDYLTAEGLPPNSRGYDMSGKDLADFEALSKNMAATAKSP